jgi:hypothetical protein
MGRLAAWFSFAVTPTPMLLLPTLLLLLFFFDRLRLLLCW